jgi:hypothetical protein
MGLSKQASLRNFAVLQKVSRSHLGDFYRVQDRRATKETHLLFVPNKFRCWPRYLEPCSDVGGSCVRLRDGKIGYLFPNSVGLQNLYGVLKIGVRSRLDFSPISGFTTTRYGGKWRKTTSIALLVGVTVGTICYISFSKQNVSPKVASAGHVRQNQKFCTEDSLVSENFNWLPNAKSLRVAHEIFSVANSELIGGFLHATLESNCNRKPFSIDAWFNGNSYEIDSVN